MCHSDLASDRTFWPPFPPQTSQLQPKSASRDLPASAVCSTPLALRGSTDTSRATTGTLGDILSPFRRAKHAHNESTDTFSESPDAHSRSTDAHCRSED